MDKLFSTYVKFPDSGDNEVIDGYRIFGFRNCGGAINGAHIPIIAPKEHHADYVRYTTRNVIP